MGKYRGHRERRGKRRGNEVVSDEVSEPSYFRAIGATPEAVDAEVIWVNVSKGFGFVKLTDGSEAYLDIRILEAAGSGEIASGTKLKIVTEESPHGRQVVKILDIGDEALMPSAEPLVQGMGVSSRIDALWFLATAALEPDDSFAPRLSMSVARLAPMRCVGLQIVLPNRFGLLHDANGGSATRRRYG